MYIGCVGTGWRSGGGEVLELCCWNAMVVVDRLHVCKRSRAQANPRAAVLLTANVVFHYPKGYAIVYTQKIYDRYLECHDWETVTRQT